MKPPCKACGGVGHVGPATGARQEDYGRACTACYGTGLKDGAYIRTTTRPYYVESWGEPGDKWWVTARNNVTVATCSTERSARRIARLLNADAAATADKAGRATAENASGRTTQP